MVSGGGLGRNHVEEWEAVLSGAQEGEKGRN